MTGFIQYLRWQYCRNNHYIVLLLIIQALISIGIIFGFSYLIPEMDTMSAIYLTTGAPTVILLSIGLAMLPQFVAEDKSLGLLEYMLSWPVGRHVYILGDAVYWFSITLPGIFLALLTGSWHLNITLTISIQGLLVLLFTGIMSMSVGYAMAVLLPPKTTMLVSQILIFAILLFSPINFPAERLPEFLALIHRFLPLQHAADAMRASFAPEYFQTGSGSYLIIGAWTILAFLASLLALSKRK